MRASAEPSAQTPEGSAERPSDAILTVPNLITLARLALIPLFLWLALGPKRDALAFLVGFVLGSTDFLDGVVARRFHQVSKIGSTIDPLVDRFAIGAAGAVLIVRDFAPWGVVVAVIARDALVLAAVPFLSARSIPRPAVSFVGKAATTGIMWGFGLFIAAAAGDAGWIRVLAWIALGTGLALSYAAAVDYGRTAVRALRAAPSG